MTGKHALLALGSIFGILSCGLGGPKLPSDPAEIRRLNGHVFDEFYCSEGKWPASIVQAENFAKARNLPHALSAYTGAQLNPLREIELQVVVPKESGKEEILFFAEPCPVPDKPLSEAFGYHGGAIEFIPLRGFAPLPNGVVMGMFEPYDIPDLSFGDARHNFVFGIYFHEGALSIDDLRGLKAQPTEKIPKPPKLQSVKKDRRLWRYFEHSDKKGKSFTIGYLTSFFGRPFSIIARGPANKSPLVRKFGDEILKHLTLKGDEVSPLVKIVAEASPTPKPTAAAMATAPATARPQVSPTAVPTPIPTKVPTLAATPTPKPGIEIGVKGVRVVLPDGMWKSTAPQRTAGSAFVELTMKKEGKMFAYLYALEGSVGTERLMSISRNVARKVSSVVVDGGAAPAGCGKYELQVRGEVTYLDSCTLIGSKASVLVMLFSTKSDASMREAARAALVRGIELGK